MAAKQPVENLIADLRRATSGVEQLKIIARGWATVRKLSRKERVQLATHVGLEEAKTLLERFGQPGGVSPALLAEAVLKAERANPGELNRLLSDLRDSEKRAGALRESVRLAEAALVEAEKPAPEVQTAPPPPLPKPALKETVDREPGRPTPRAESPPKKTDTTPTPATPPAAAPPVRKAPSEPTAQAPSEDEELLDRQPSREPAKEVVELPTPLPAAPSAASASAVESPPEPSLPPAVEADLALDAEPTLMGRFRRLNRLARHESASTANVDKILRAFPAGWPRRRALTALIRAGALQDVDRFLDAVSQFENSRDEFWCVSAFAQNRDLTPEELQKLAEGLSHRSSRRLLKRIRVG